MEGRVGQLGEFTGEVTLELFQKKGSSSQQKTGKYSRQRYAPEHRFTKVCYV